MRQDGSAEFISASLAFGGICGAELWMNFLKPMLLRCIRVFRTIDRAQEHRKRAGIDAVRSVECLMDDEQLARSVCSATVSML